MAFYILQPTERERQRITEACCHLAIVEASDENHARSTAFEQMPSCGDNDRWLDAAKTTCTELTPSEKLHQGRIVGCVVV